MSEVRLSDEEARRAIGEDLHRTLFVEAGAGTGKTRSLVGRIVQLVRDGIPMANIAAITFTEKAAVELRERLRKELTGACLPGCRGSEALSAALEELDGAAVCTLHSFAQRVLREHAVDAGLPPRLEMLDEIGAEIDFSDAWDRFVDGLLVEPTMRRSLVLADALGMRMANLRDVARRLADNWDLAADRIDRSRTTAEIPELSFDDLASEMLLLAGERHRCLVEEDSLATALADLEETARRLHGADEPVAVSTLLRIARGSRRQGNKNNWPAGYDKQDVHARLKELRDDAGRRLDQVGAQCAGRLLSHLATFTQAEVERRRTQGRLLFHDLLVFARDLLADPEAGPMVRRRLRERYRRLLIDEFQDTDPIQVELAHLIAGDPESPGGDDGDGTGADDGRLFIVGDPKQSLYRFRRADIGAYLREAERAGADARETLTTNWRSSPEIIAWVNAVFGRLIEADADSQPHYVHLVAPPATEREPTRDRTDARVLLLGADAAGAVPAAELREREFAEVAALARRSVTEGWPVAGTAGPRPIRLNDICVLIPGRTVLQPLVAAFDAAGVSYRVESSSLVYGTRAETDLLAVLRAVDDPSDHLAVVTALRSAAFGFGDDELYEYRRLCDGARGAVESGGALRHRPWDYLSPQPAHAVSAALRWLATLHEERLWASPGEVVDRVVRERRLMELAFADNRHRDTWRRLRRAVDQARAFSDATAGTLRDYLRWVDMQRDEGTRVVEALVPEADDDSVRVMTVHAAKGLQFPFVIVAGFSGTAAPLRGPRTPAIVFPAAGGVACRLGGRVTTAGFEAVVETEKRHEFHEDVRKLYVACTRAREYLAVSVFRTGRRPGEWNKLSGEEAGRLMTLAELLATAVEDVTTAEGDGAVDPAPEGEHRRRPVGTAVWPEGRPIETLVAGESSVPSPAPATDGFPAAKVPPYDQWRREHAAVKALAARHAVISASRVSERVRARPALPALGDAAPVALQDPDPGRQHRDPELHKDEPGEDLPVWGKGRGGSAFGRAVHAVLQTVGPDPGERGVAVDSAARRHAAVEGVSHRAADVARRVRYALDSPAVRDAARSPHWSELYVGAEIAGTLLEGFVDLLYEAPDGSLVVVDFKTDSSDDLADLEERRERYASQLAAYALMLAESTGSDVSRAVLLFLGPTGAHEMDVEDLPHAIARVRGALARESSGVAALTADTLPDVDSQESLR